MDNNNNNNNNNDDDDDDVYGISTMNVKELKEFISSVGLIYTDCYEKSELKKRALEAAMIKLKTKPTNDDNNNNESSSSSSSSSSNNNNNNNNNNKEIFAGLDCHIFRHNHSMGQDVDLVCIFYHGYGATSSQFLEFTEFLCNISILSQIKILFIIPQAPNDINGTPAWWPINIMEWGSNFMQGEQAIAKMIRTSFPGLSEARERSMNLIKDVIKFLKVTDNNNKNENDLSKICIGGFSQGAMLSVDTALSLSGNVAGVCSFSGFPIVVEEWAEKTKHHQGLKVLQTHGTQDQLLPFTTSTWLKQLLENGKLNVKYETHEGGHEVGPPTIFHKIASFLSEIASSSSS